MLSEQMNFRLYDYPQAGPLPTADIRASGSNFSPRVVHLMERATARDCRPRLRCPGSRQPQPRLVRRHARPARRHMKLWMDEGACDGFNIMPAYFQDELELFVDQAVPLLQRRGLFRTDYTARPCATISACRSHRASSS